MNEIEKKVENVSLQIAKGISLSILWLIAAFAAFRYGYGFILDEYGPLEALAFATRGAAWRAGRE